MRSRCVICRKFITVRFPLCSGCIEEHGKVRTTWPDWLQFLVGDTRRIRKAMLKRTQQELSIADLGPHQARKVETVLYGTLNIDGVAP